MFIRFATTMIDSDSHRQKGMFVAAYELLGSGKLNAADSGVSLAILGLLDPDPTKRLPADGRNETFQIGSSGPKTSSFATRESRAGSSTIVGS